MLVAYYDSDDDDGEAECFERSKPETPFMTPTEDQQRALDLMTSWLSEGYSNGRWSHAEPFFLLQGYAGTGKSFSITQLAKAGLIPPNQICFTAPTNKAVKVLRNYLDSQGLQSCGTKTIFSLLGLSLQANGEVKEIKKPDEPVDLSQFKAIVVDEGSMVNSFLMSAVEEACADWNVPFIFMGDPAQLPPVGEDSSPIWKIPNSVTLTQVLRYGDAMLELATRIRNVVDHPFPTIKIETAAPVHVLRKPEWLSTAFDHLEDFIAGEAKIISWRNVTVEEYNILIRRKIYGAEAAKDPWLPGDKLVAREPCKDFDQSTVLHTSEEAEVLEVREVFHPTLPQYEVFQLLVKTETGAKRNLYTLTPSGQREVSEALNQLQMEAKQPGKGFKWREFWGLKESFHQLRHSYALTSHMSQGSSYRIVFCDREDILRNRNRGEAFRSLYVACTRQREKLYIA